MLTCPVSDAATGISFGEKNPVTSAKQVAPKIENLALKSSKLTIRVTI